MIGWVVRLLAFLTGVALATPVLAHAALVGSDPADGSVVATAPSIIALRFNEPVMPISARLLDDRGMATDLTAQLRAVGDSIVVTAPAMGEGTHSIVWRVTSADGHPIGGTLVLSVGRVTAGGAPSASADPAVSATIWAVRALLYAGLFLGVGGAFFSFWVAGRTALTPALRRSLLGLLALGFVAAVLALGLQGVDVLGVALGAVFSPAPWQAALATSYSETIAIALAAIALAAAPFFLLNPAADRALTAVALIGVGAALAVSGHATDLSAQSLAWFAILIHGIAVAFWVGALLPLALLLAGRRPGSAAVLARFSRAIPYAVASLIAAGLFLAILELQQPGDLWNTGYGQVLSLKLVAVVLLLALALANRIWLTPAINRGAPAARTGMVRSIGVELALVAVAFGVVALWRFTPPPRALAAAANLQPVFAHLMQPDVNAMAEITITPGRAGPVSASILVMDARGMPLDPRAVSVALSDPAAGIEPIMREATKAPDGTWRIDGMILPVGGTWQADLAIAVTDFDQVTLQGPILLP